MCCRIKKNKKMNVAIAYKELSDGIEKKFNLRPEFSYVDEKTFEVSYKASAFLPALSVRFHLETVQKEVLCLSYDCGKAAMLMISGAISYLEKQLPKGIEVNTVDQRITIYPKQFKPMEKALEYVTLTHIAFENEAVRVGLAMV